ncbi:unnamed protein product [Urochloa humidicola]
MAQVPSESSKSDTKTSSDEAPPESYGDLPTRGGWVKPLVLYQNYWLNPERLKHIIPRGEARIWLKGGISSPSSSSPLPFFFFLKIGWGRCGGYPWELGQ